MPDVTTTATRMELLDYQIARALIALEGPSELLTRMGDYSLGLVGTQGEETEPDVRAQVQGKRLRPQIAMLVAEAVGGSAEQAAPGAAAIELLHNFTLIHDDIQDRSPNRRHRPTVWRVWGDGQAINAGDALFAVSQLALLNSAQYVSAETLLLLAQRFNRCTIDIVRGQVQDINNEGRADVTPGDYLEMIGGKTAAILEFSAWAGATVGGADDATARRLGELGLAIGLGFQIRDDMLGIWSPASETGKDAADDIRRKKQSLPILILRANASAEDTERINHIYAQEEIDEQEVEEMLGLLAKYGVEAQTLEHVEVEHRRAMAILDDVFGDTDASAVYELRTLITQLVNRSF
ncbi:MAG: polyprenyl synthetase family protein [Thermomicrobiales bacterium]|nr:polyprenyl synthetase family protein [Thermomicrobiales bacterium]